MSWKENIKIIFDSSSEKSKEDQLRTLKVIGLTLYPLGIFIQIVMVWFFAREYMYDAYFLLLWVFGGVVTPGVIFYATYKGLKRPEDKKQNETIEEALRNRNKSL